MKKRISLTIVSLMLFALLVNAADMPIYNPPPGAKTEESENLRAFNRGIKLGLLDELSGLSAKKQEEKPVKIIPLAPAHTGLTTVSQPVIQWHINRDWSDGVITFVIDELHSRRPAPLFTCEIGGPSEKGIYQINLAHYGISLDSGKKYQWFLSARHKGSKISAGGRIKHVKPDEILLRQLGKTPTERHVFVYADAGYWYDCIHEAVDMTNKNPGNIELAQRRDSLLSQIGLELDI